MLGFVNFYTVVNIVLVVATLLGAVIHWISNVKKPLLLNYRQQLKLHYTLAVAPLSLGLVSLFWRGTEGIAPKAQIWTAPSARALRKASYLLTSPALTVGGKNIAWDGIFHLSSITVILIFIGIVFATAKLLLSIYRLRKVIRYSIEYKSLHRTHIRISTREMVPFSCWLPGANFVIVPSSFLDKPEELKLVIKHELQHHRHGDTRWLYLVQTIKAFCFWNPASYFLEKSISALQEFACDEALLGQAGVSSTAYCRCLLWVAESSASMQHPKHLVSATRIVMGMANATTNNILKRRLHMILSNPPTECRSKSSRALLGLCTGALSLGILGWTAFAASDRIQDHRISLEDAKKMAENVQQSSEFPLVVNELVLAQLNRYLGTPDGRKYMQESLERMELHKETIVKYLEQYGLPRELIAVPIVESGYRNLEQDGIPKHGAGLWMFIATTAKQFGLRVDNIADERLDVRLETDAAMRLLGAMHLQFSDWYLALMAYNMGPRGVEKAIEDVGSRDAWQLIRNGHENDPNYLAEIVAAVLIMKNPQVMQSR